MILARIAVLGAVLCSLWFNGSYAAAKAAGEANQFAMVAVSLTIDLCKCGFLPAASALWALGQRLAAAVLVALWPLAFGFSLFAGYASVATNRANAGAHSETKAQHRTQAQTDYDAAAAAIAKAKESDLWDTTAACTNAKTKTQRSYCANMTALTTAYQTASTTLNNAPIVPVEPELVLLATLTAWQRPSLAAAVAFAPALILELVSSLGLYATRRRQPHQSQPRRRFKWFSSAKRKEVAETPPKPILTPSHKASAPLAPSDGQLRW